LVAPDYFGQTNGGAGFADLAAGFKQQLGPKMGFDVSLILMLSFPAGSREFSSHGYDPFVQLPWSPSLSPNWTAAGMLSVYFPTQGNRRNATGGQRSCWIGSWQNHGMRSLSTHAIFQSLAVQGICFMSAPLTKFGRDSNSTCTSESGYREPRWITLLVLDTRFGFR
jgi:hypothetical protein